VRLRPYQVEAVNGVAAAWRGGAVGALLVVPTGGGKTVIYSEITRQIAGAGRPVLIVEPAVELVEQTRDKLERMGVGRVGIIAAGWGDGYNPDRGALVQVATVQTLRSRPDALLQAPHLTIFDEAHLSAAESYRMIRERYPRSRRLGVTATPYRLDGLGFEDLAEEIVIGPTVPQLIAAGALVPFRTRSIPLTDFSASSRRPRSEFNRAQMEKAYQDRALVGDVVDHYLQSGKAGKTGIVFAAGTGHARELTDRFVACGVAAEYLDGQTPKAQRRAILARLASGATTIVVNFGVLAAGFDCPRVEYVGIARATASLALWVQMAGRGLRPEPETCKGDCLVDDFGGNALRHGNLAFARTYSLAGRNAADDDVDAGDLGKVCPTCRVVCDALALECDACGHSFAADAELGGGGKPRKKLKAIDGRLVEIAADAGVLELEAQPSPEERKAAAAVRGGVYLKRRALTAAQNFGDRFADRGAR
jgi:DNA repair protein RadD